MRHINMYMYVYVYTYSLCGMLDMSSFLDGYCSTVQGLLDWFVVDQGFTELLFIQIDLCVMCVFVLYSPVSLSSCMFIDTACVGCLTCRPANGKANPTWGVIFGSSKLKARTSLLPRFREKRRSSFEL